MKDYIQRYALIVCMLLGMTASLAAFSQESILLDAPSAPADSQPSNQATTPTPTPSPAPAPTPTPIAPVKKVSGPPATITQVSLIDSTRGPQLKVVTSAQVSDPVVQVLTNPNRFVMDIPNTKLAKIKREMSTSVGQVRLGTHDGEVRVVVDFGTSPTPTYQITNDTKQISVSFGTSPLPAVATPSTPRPPVASAPTKGILTDIPDFANRDRQKIFVEFRDADIRNVLHFIADASGMNIVVSEKVRGKVSARLNGVPWYEALESVLRTQKLTYTQSDGVIKVVTLAELDENRKSEKSNGAYPKSDGAVITRLIPVNYGLAKDLSAQIKEILSPQGRVNWDERTNMIIVSDIPAALDRASGLVKSLDTQTPQILIEARMVEAELNFSRSLGIQWGGSVGNVAFSGANPSYAINLPAKNPTSAVGLQLGTLNNWAVINARLTAAEQTGRVKTVSMPKIMTLDNKSARITQGYQIPVSFSNASIVSTQFVYAALQLDVVPHVSSDGSIMMTIKMTNNEPDFDRQDKQGVPAIRTKEAMTELLVKDGETAVIGGIYTRDQRNEVSQTPVLGSIPIIGLLFKSTGVRDSQREMMVFLTPRLVNKQQAGTLESHMVDDEPESLKQSLKH